MVIILVTVASLTLCMLFWENISLMKTAKHLNYLDDHDNNFYEVQGHKITSPDDIKSILKTKLRPPKLPKMVIKPWSPNDAEMKNDDKNEEDNNPNNELEIEQNYYNTEPILHYNPLNHPQCQNAIIDHENINKNELLSKHLSNIKCELPKGKKQPNRGEEDKFIPFIWTREFVSALTSERCFEPRTPIRTTQDFYNEKRYEQVDNEVPVFYHIPKCGSSSTAAMTSELFNFSIHWRPGPDRMHEPIHTKCGWAFIRDPIQRFISAYYTINKKIYREMKHEFHSAPDRIPERFVDRLTFLTVVGEPQRFEAFMNDLFRYPDWWGIEDPLKHISSQSYFLSNWYGSDITFFGRVEHFGQHWKLLMNQPECHWFRDLYQDHPEIDLENYEVSHALFHYGTMGDGMWRARDDRQKEYIEALGMFDMLKKMYGRDRKKYNISEQDVLPPAYYFLTESMYNQIVNFYHQDFVCFGYKPDFSQFREYVESKKNPFEITL